MTSSAKDTAQLLRKRNTKKARKVCKIAHAERCGLAMMLGGGGAPCAAQMEGNDMQETPRATWRSYDPDLNRVDWVSGERPLKPHEREARDLGLLAFARVLAGMKDAREASPRAHVIAWQRTPAGIAHEQAKLAAARAACKTIARDMLREMRRASA